MRNHHIIAFLFALFIHAGLFLLPFLKKQSNEKTQIIITPGNKSQVSINNFSLTKNKPAHSSAISPNTQSMTEKVSDQSTSTSKGVEASKSEQENTLSFARFSPPQYPHLAREKGLEGIVAINAQYDREGTVTEVKIIKSSGIKILDESVLSAAKTWKINTSEAGSFQKNFEFKLNN
jgi:protein TonB